MEEKDDWTCGREGDRHPFTEINLQDEFVTPITLVLNYITIRKTRPTLSHSIKHCNNSLKRKSKIFIRHVLTKDQFKAHRK